MTKATGNAFYPMRLKPCYKDYLWGGKRLKTEFGKTDAPEITAESWELSCRPEGMSVIDNGPHRGKTIQELREMDHVEFFGSHCDTEEFPVLVKLIDAQQPLSIQVHPSSESARIEDGEQAKAELWYVVDCVPHAYLYYGFSRRISEDELLCRAEDGSICEVLNRVPVSQGDVFYILPGTIHAIGAGILIAEIQQNSNTTFRIYDYQRKGPDGKRRTLHLERAASVLDYSPVIPEECRANSGLVFPSFILSEMFSCPHFRAFCLDVLDSVRLSCDGQTFQHLMCVDGGGEINCNGTVYPFAKGASYLMPAMLGTYEIEGKCRVLLTRL